MLEVFKMNNELSLKHVNFKQVSIYVLVINPFICIWKFRTFLEQLFGFMKNFQLLLQINYNHYSYVGNVNVNVLKEAIKLKGTWMYFWNNIE